MAQLNHDERCQPGTGAGTASVTFTISRMGEVLSARLANSSGDRALDAEAVSQPRRASPLPAPPPGIGAGGSVTIAAASIADPHGYWRTMRPSSSRIRGQPI
jgi:protein TonB